MRGDDHETADVSASHGSRATALAVAALATGGTFVLLDLLWLGLVARDVYESALGTLRRPVVFWPAAVSFYGMYIVAIVIYAVVGARTMASSVRRGAALGLVAYSTYGLTNWAVVRDWPAELLPLDIGWGVVLTAIAGLAGTLARAGLRGGSATDAAQVPSDLAWTRRGESLLAIWARRAVTVPCYLLLTLVYVALAPLWAFVALAADVSINRSRRLPRLRALTFFALYLVCEVVGIVAATTLAAVTLGGRIGGPVRYRAANAALQRWWSDALFNGGLRLFSMRVQVDGAERTRGGPFLLFVRHCSTADTVLAAALVANPHRVLLRYVLKRELLWDPCLDIVGRRLPNAFVDRSTHDPGEIEAVAKLARDLDAASAVLIYPEGTRFGREKLARAVAKLRERGMHRLAEIAGDFRCVLPPRLGGALALLDAAPDIDLVLLEHTGFEGAATFVEFWSGALVGKTIRVRLRRFLPSEIPDQARDEWLFQRWAEMDGWIRSHAIVPSRRS